MWKITRDKFVKYKGNAVIPKMPSPEISSDVNHPDAKNAKMNIFSHLAG